MGMPWAPQHTPPPVDATHPLKPTVCRRLPITPSTPEVHQLLEKQ